MAFSILAGTGLALHGSSFLDAPVGHAALPVAAVLAAFPPYRSAEELFSSPAMFSK
jgi:hypothetical protein